jgi:diguanylate cyclase (GGDEF)-like protein/PAS domain S-box-containing protein
MKLTRGASWLLPSSDPLLREGAGRHRSGGSAVRLQPTREFQPEATYLDLVGSNEREAEVYASEARTRAILDAALDGIITIDHEGTIVEFNPAAERAFGYERRAVIGKQMVKLLIPPSLREAHSRGLAHYLATGEGPVLGKRIEVPAMRADGSEFPIELSIVRVDVPGQPVFTAYVRDIGERRRSESMAVGHARLLELVAAGAPLAELLDLVTRFVEEWSSDVLASILLLDRDGLHLRHGAAPSLPDAYVQAIDGVAIGPNVGSCGTAAHRRERVVVSDIANDPLWSDYRDLALSNGLRACWSTPILSSDGVLLGTFALYYRQPRSPDEHDLRLIDSVVHVASIAIGRSQSEQSLRTSEERYRDLFENANEPIATVGLDETITEVNAAFARVLGYSQADLLGSSLRDYMTEEGYATAIRETERKLSGEVAGATFEQEYIAKNGHAVILEVSTRTIIENERPVGVQGMCRDITGRKRAEAEARQLTQLNRHQALHDSLTGLPNRVYFRGEIEQAISACDRDGSELALLLIDLNHFKDINDTLGHHYGDLLLVELARRFRSVLRRTDTIARLGGDEFGMLVPQLTASASDLDQALERILGALKQPFQVNDLPLYVEASIGIARYPAHGNDVDLLMQRADVAMYVAKESGVPHALYAPDLDRHDTASLTLLSELPRAIREHELVLHYQPRADVRTCELSSVEALVRWQHPTRGLIPPDEFIPLAERTALIQPLTMYVLDEALAQCKRWDQQGHRLSVAVNLSMRNLHELTLPTEVAKLLQKWEIPGNQLTLEITESAIASDPARAKTTVEQLSALGVTISIDDFGTGYTSLAQLARLALDQIKIDRSFVLNMDTDADDATIVRSIITLGHDLDLEVVAEGVETSTAWHELERLGCDMIQGYYVSHPLPADDLSLLLHTTSKERAAERTALTPRPATTEEKRLSWANGTRTKARTDRPHRRPRV